jgi:DNA-binding PadR family transcriptional regulator
MSAIRDGILALLSLGPAYGLQLRNELDARLQRPQSTNVGQIYSTLERLRAADLISQDTQTSDGLPLYTLTEAGKKEAAIWLRKPRIEQSNRWDAMVTQIMIARSMPNHASDGLVAAFRAYWNASLEVAQESFTHSVAGDLRSSAEEALAIAALAWLDRIAETDDSGWPTSKDRPSRGRPARTA